MPNNDLSRKKIEALMLLVFVAFLIIYSSSSAQEQSMARSGISPGTDFMLSPLGDISFVSATDAILMSVSTFDGHQCFVDDNRAVGCTAKGLTTVRDFEWIGEKVWQGYVSCKGWMSYWGCNPTSCNYLNEGVCSGASSDSDKIECVRDSQCPGGYCGPEQKCIIGTAAECKSTDAYKCESGTIYHCNKGKWNLFGTCYETTKSNECVDDKADDWHNLCKDVTCKSDADCKILGIFGNKACVNARCVEQATPEMKFPDIGEWIKNNMNIVWIFGGIMLLLLVVWVFSEKKKQ